MRAWKTSARRSHEEHTVTPEPDVVGLDGHGSGAYKKPCRGYKRGDHFAPSIWIPDKLCDACLAQKQSDEGITVLSAYSDAYTREDDVAEELATLSAIRIAARSL